MNPQLELPLSKKAPKVTADEVNAFVKFLRGKDWITARDIFQLNPEGLNLSANFDNAKRKLRALKGKADGQIVSGPGSNGYKLFDECTIEDINYAINSMVHQLKEMARSIITLKRRFHARKTSFQDQ